MILTIQTERFQRFGVGKPVRLCKNNPDRVWIVVTPVSTTGTVAICTAARALLTTAVQLLSVNSSAGFLRSDFGPLITMDLWASDGNGVAYTGTLIVTQGILVPGS